MLNLLRSDSESSIGSLRLSPPSPPRYLRDLSSGSESSTSTISISMVHFTSAPAKRKPKPESACGFYTIEQVIPFLVARIVKDSNGVAEMITKLTKEKNLTFLTFKKKCIGEWKQSLQLAANVYKKKKIAVVPINIVCKSDAHLNMVIFNPNMDTVERYEPHGLESPSDCTGANTVLDVELETELKKLLPSATYVRRADTHEYGFQSLEEKAPENSEEGGFCATWSALFAQERIRRPNVSATYAIRQMQSTFGSDPINLRNIARRQAKALKTNIGFNFDTYMNEIFYTSNLKNKQLKPNPGRKGTHAINRLNGKVYTSYIKSLFGDTQAPKAKPKAPKKGKDEVSSDDDQPKAKPKAKAKP
jgi:hypothetical protein